MTNSSQSGKERHRASMTEKERECEKERIERKYESENRR